MDKILVILVNRNNDYIRPFNLVGYIDEIIRRLSFESKCNQFVYCLYKLDDKLSRYIPCYYLYDGACFKASDYFVRV